MYPNKHTGTTSRLLKRKAITGGTAHRFMDKGYRHMLWRRPRTIARAYPKLSIDRRVRSLRSISGLALVILPLVLVFIVLLSDLHGDVDVQVACVAQ